MNPYISEGSVKKKKLSPKRKNTVDWNKVAKAANLLKDEEHSPENTPIVRPPAVYTNSRSPFGIADELHGVHGS